MVYIYLFIFFIVYFFPLEHKLQEVKNALLTVADGHSANVCPVEGFIHSSDKQLLNAYPVPGTLPDAGDMVVSNTGEVPTHKDLTF